jgi:hypothetical protein
MKIKTYWREGHSGTVDFEPRAIHGRRNVTNTQYQKLQIAITKSFPLARTLLRQKAFRWTLQ